MRAEVLRIESLSKKRNGHRILKSLTFSVFENETLAIFGANNTERNTLVSLLSGNSLPDSGFIYIDDKKRQLKSPKISNILGIRTIYEQSHVLENLTIAENIGLGKERSFLQSRAKYNRSAKKFIDAVFLNDFPPNTRASQLTLTQKALVELAAALATHPKILIFDKAYLFNSEEELNLLRSIFKTFNKLGTTVIYFSQSIDFARKLADRLLIMHNGISLGMFNRAQYYSTKLSSIYKSVFSVASPDTTAVPSETLLDVRSLSGEVIRDISFKVKKGEIVGIFDFDEMAKAELLNILVGISPKKDGRIILDKKELKFSSPNDSLKQGIAYAPSFASANGFLPNISVKENITLSALDRVTSFGVIRPSLENYYAKTSAEATNYTGDLNVSANSINESLQQKALITRCISCNPKLLILDEPFKGMDTSSRDDIIKCINEIAKDGISTLISSIDLQELKHICNRVFFIKEKHFQ